MNVLILGGNAAGMSAASRIKRKNPNSNVTVIEKSDVVSYGACGLPYYVAGINDDLSLMQIRAKEDFIKAGINLKTLVQATEVNFDKKQVTVQNTNTNECYTEKYDKLLISTGSSAIVPNLSGIQLGNIFTLKTLDDGERVKKEIEKTDVKNVVVIGGGYIGIEVAEACILQNKNVTLIEAQSNILSTFDTEFSEMAAKEMIAKGVSLKLEEKVTSFEGDTTVKKVVTDKQSYDAELVIMAIGVRPNTGFLQNINMLKNGAVVTNAAMETSVKDVYAAGDCASVVHKILKKDMYIPLGTNANKQGRLAGDAILGKEVNFNRALGTSMIRFEDIELAKTGIGEKEAKEANIAIKCTTIVGKTHARYYPVPTPVTLKLCYDEKTKVILGAQIAGEKNTVWRINVLACAIDNEMTTEELGFLDMGYAPPYTSVWDAIHIAANASK